MQKQHTSGGRGSLINRLRRRIALRGVAAALLVAAGSPAAMAAEKEDLSSLSFIELVNSADPGKQSELIQKFQKREAQTKLMNGKYNPSGDCTIETYRNREVLLITIPARLLFAPNEVSLKPGAAEYLQPLRRYLKDPDMYRVILAMHTDNTGSEEYRDLITVQRADAVFDWFEQSGSDTRYLFPFAMGDELPMAENNSMENRDRNRRLEVYLVPGSKMVEQAKTGRIAF